MGEGRDRVRVVYHNQLLDHFFHIHTANFRIPTKISNYSQLFKLLYRIRGRVMWNLIVTLRMNVWVMNDRDEGCCAVGVDHCVSEEGYIARRGVTVTVVLRVLKEGC